MMQYWMTRPDAPIVQDHVKRFDPLHWTVDFPRGAMASVVTGAEADAMTVSASFLRRNDMVGLIYESSDRHMHPAHRREMLRDYSHCVLRFRWRSEGLVALDAVNGPTLTIEGRDASGAQRTWYVRLWNYAKGTGTDAEITLDFDRLDGGFSLPADADRVSPLHIDRMFFTLVPPGFEASNDAHFPQAAEARLTLSGLRSDGSGSVLAINDATVPEHHLRICTAYDDLYHLPPERVIDAVERLGYRKIINHYIGMSHYFVLGGDGLVDDRAGLNAAALEWHRGFAAEAARRGYEIIWSLSYEILDMFCPEAWKQRHWDGGPALTGYDPPSTLISPASAPAVAYLGRIAAQLADLSRQLGMPVNVQVGEPWWWIDRNNRPCFYDEGTRSQIGPDLTRIDDVRGEKTPDEKRLLDQLGSLLANSTSSVADAVRVNHPDARLLLLTYLCGSLDPEAPEVKRANLPVEWSYPAFDVLQLEDYEWVTEGRLSLRREAVEAAAARLRYPPANQHYLAGFAARAGDHLAWDRIFEAAEDARNRGVAEVFVWALPQILRDGLTVFGGSETVKAFDDVSFPIEIGAEASVAPGFSTTVVTSASGHEFRNSNWQQARLTFDAGPGVRSEAELQELIAFFRARRGSAVAFRFRDPYDHSSARGSGPATSADQTIGKGDGEKLRFELVKSYGSGECRRITRPVPGSVRIAINGEERSAWSLEPGGSVLFDDPPPDGSVVTAGYLFDVPVRFAEDRLEINRSTFQAGEAPSVPLIEVREDLP